MKLGSFLMKNIKTFRSEILASVNTVYEHMIPQPDWEMGNLDNGISSLPCFRRNKAISGTMVISS